MKATELIKRLQELVDKHGDLDVVFPHDDCAVSNAVYRFYKTPYTKVDATEICLE